MSAVDEFVSLEGWLDCRGHDETGSTGHRTHYKYEDVFDIMSSILRYNAMLLRRQTECKVDYHGA
jgi:hypothetical protein